MKKTKLTIALLGSIVATTSVYADDLNADIVHQAITTYSNDVEVAADTDVNSPIFAVKSIAADAGNIQANGAKLAKGLVLTDDGSVKIPNAVKPKSKYMVDEATANEGIAKYTDEKIEIKSTMDRWKEKRAKVSGFGKRINKLNYDRKLEQKRAERKALNVKINILEGIANGDKAYAEEKIAQFNTIKELTVNGPKAYLNDIAKPVSGHLTAAWDAATKFDYIDYRNNIDMFWDARVALWNGEYNINSEDADTAVAFNDVTNYLTIQAIKAIQKSDTTEGAVKLYADANTLAYTVTSLGDVESQIQAKIASPLTAQSICEANLMDVRANSTVTSARNVVNGLSDPKAVEAVLTTLLDKINVGDIKVYDLSTLGNSWAIKAAVAAISVAIGQEGVVYVKDKNLMLRPASAIATPVAEAIASNSIYQEVGNADSILFGDNSCNFTAAKDSSNKVAQALVAASHQIAGELSEGGVVEPGFEEQVYVALQATMFENLDKVLPNK